MLFFNIRKPKWDSLWVIFCHYLSALSRPDLDSVLHSSLPISSLQLCPNHISGAAEPPPPSPPSDAQSLIYKVVSSSDPSLSLRPADVLHGYSGMEQRRMNRIAPLKLRNKVLYCDFRDSLNPNSAFPSLGFNFFFQRTNILRLQDYLIHGPLY